MSLAHKSLCAVAVAAADSRIIDAQRVGEIFTGVTAINAILMF